MIEQSAVAERAERMATEASEIALAIVVDSQPMFEIAGEELRAIKKRKDEIEELRLSLTRPLDESKKGIMALFKPPVERLEKAEAALRGAMVGYQREQQRLIDDAKRAAEAKAAEERAALERAHAEALVAGNASKAAAALDALELADVAPVTPIAVAQPKATGISSRQNWRAEVTDFKALVIAAGKHAEVGDDTMLGYLEANTTALGGVARALKAQARIPGVRVYAESGIAVRTA